MIHLKTLAENDITQLECNWYNDPEVIKYLYISEKITVESQREYVREKNEKEDCYLFGIFCNHKLIGTVKAELIEKKTSHKEDMKFTLGLMIGDKNYWGKGIAVEASKLMIDYIAKNTKHKKIWLGCDIRNKRALKVWKKAGFKFEEVFKHYSPVRKRKYKEIIMSKNI
jgi:RimJ/RimL family protein N-acetyltransferase